jgi:hypothetical protein
MATDKAHLEEVAAFIKDHRGNEADFALLYKKLVEESTGNGEPDYQQTLAEIKDKAAEEYKTAKERTPSAWPEFEKFVTAFEKAVLKALHP